MSIKILKLKLQKLINLLIYFRKNLKENFFFSSYLKYCILALDQVHWWLLYLKYFLKWLIRFIWLFQIRKSDIKFILFFIYKRIFEYEIMIIESNFQKLSVKCYFFIMKLFEINYLFSLQENLNESKTNIWV